MRKNSMLPRAKSANRFVSVLLSLALFFTLPLMMSPVCTLTVHADTTHRILENLPLVIDGRNAGVIRTIHFEYGGNRFLSLRDTAYLLNGTGKQFRVTISGSEIAIRTGEGYQALGGEGSGFYTKAEESTFADDVGTQIVPMTQFTTESFRLNPLTVNDRSCRYFSMLCYHAGGVRDAFLSLTDLAMLLDADFSISGGTLYCTGDGHFTVDLDRLRTEGLFDEVKGALVGNASTGEIYAAYHENVSLPMASTTKLMTAFCFMDAVSEGKTSLSGTATISREAAALSTAIDGQIPLREGQTVPIRDLLYASLLPSSNECTLALAECADGSEEAFVRRMNEKAAALSLSAETRFINCHGLPEYSDNIATSEVQNHISAKDMFVLVSRLLETYPEIKEITSTKEVTSAALNRALKNTNPLLYNMAGVTGLKTGTTNAAGSCLVSSLDLQQRDQPATIVAVVLGAPDGVVRSTVSALLLRYGAQCAAGEDAVHGENETGTRAIPDDPQEVIRRLLRRMS